MAEDKDKIQERLELLAEIAGKDLLAKTVQMFGECEAEYLRDTQGFSFKCARWGDWLEISVTRLGNPDPYHGVDYKTYSGAVFLKNVKTMKLTPGHGPDLNGTASYTAANAELVTTDYSVASRGRRLFDQKSGASSQYGTVCGYRYFVKHKTTNLPRLAEDDRIVFEGVGTLYAPAGYGQDVYEEILTAKDMLPARKAGK